MSIVTSVVVFFAANPEEELTTQDISIKWRTTTDKARISLYAAEKAGWIQRKRKKDPSSACGARNIYSAGPRLLREIGK